ncbi:MAG: hypothetical protein K0S42_2377 [Microvirga sp.]|jgi:hypothetical protein|nr:hypothetical protein [Microvirga sp.]
MTASPATLLKTAQDLGIALPPDRMGITAKELQALIREERAKHKQVRKIDLDQDPKPGEPKRRGAPKSSANVVPISTAKKSSAALTRPPKPAPAFKPARPGTRNARSWLRPCCAPRRDARRADEPHRMGSEHGLERDHLGPVLAADPGPSGASSVWLRSRRARRLPALPGPGAELAARRPRSCRRRE